MNDISKAASNLKPREVVQSQKTKLTKVEVEKVKEQKISMWDKILFWMYQNNEKLGEWIQTLGSFAPGVYGPISRIVGKVVKLVPDVNGAQIVKGGILFKGKKTYIVAVAFLALAIVPLAFGVVIPEYVYGILGAIGLASLRDGIASISGNKGWKTYVAAIATVAISILSALGVNVPLDVIYGVLGAIGVVGVRDAVSKIQ